MKSFFVSTAIKLIAFMLFFSYYFIQLNIELFYCFDSMAWKGKTKWWNKWNANV